MSKSRPSYPPTKSDWETHETIITQLYRARKLKDVMIIMENQYGFRANERMYKARFPKFKVRKYGRHKNTAAVVLRTGMQPEESGSMSDVIPMFRNLTSNGTINMDQIANGFRRLERPLFLDASDSIRLFTANVEKVVFFVRQYSELRLESIRAERQVTTTMGLRKSTTLSLDEELWQKLYKGLALLEQGAQNEAFKMLNVACRLARPVLLDQPWLIFRALFMVFGTSRWHRFRDVWKALLRYLAAMASILLRKGHPIPCVLHALCDDEAVLNASAELSLRQILESLRRLLGPVHPEILRTKRNLSVVLRRQSEADESEETAREAVTACEQQLGFVHVETLRCLRRLASLYMHHGKVEEAEGLFVEALRRAGRPDNALGPTTDDTDTFIYANRDLAIIAMQQQDMEKCLQRLREFSSVCHSKLSMANVRYTRSVEEPPQPFTMVGAEQYIKDVVMAYDLHCDELASRLMSKSARRTMSNAPEMTSAPATYSTATSSSRTLAR